ncbi:MAG: hypothetical protein Q7R39_11065 [Dehalococcoidia bacterium]|nr:hypothetical protein [Dehalococcoidia bacterium]
MMLKEDMEWLEQVNSRLWDSAGDRIIEKVSGGKDTLTKLFGLLGTDDTICTLENWRWGFGIALLVWRPPSFVNLPPEHLVSVGDDHLFSATSVPEGMNRNAAAYEVFKPIVFRPRNIEMCQMFKLPAPQPFRHYEY